MKRFHLNLSVKDLQESIAFYTALFGSAPAVLKPDYAKWMLEDPRINFAISTRGESLGIEHVGIQAEDEQELREVYNRLKQARGTIWEEGKTSCCYPKSEKSWISDPQGLEWEAFYTFGESTVYGEGKAEQEACCVKI